MPRLLQRMLTLAAVFAIAAAAGCAGKTTGGAWEEKLDELRPQLEEALEAQDYARAETLALEAIAALPNEPSLKGEVLPSLLEPLAFALFKQEKHEAAEARYRELFILWDAQGVPEETQFQRLPAFFEFADLLGAREKYDEQEALLKRATLLAQNMVRRVSGYYLQQPVLQVGGQAFARYLSGGLLDLARFYVAHERYAEADAVARRAVWAVERLYAMNPTSVEEVRGYYGEFAQNYPEDVTRAQFQPGIPAFETMPPVAWLDVPPELGESDLLLWDKHWYDAQVAEGSGDFEKALPHYYRTVEIGQAYRVAGGEEPEPLLLAMSAAARTLYRLGRDDEAAEIHADAVEFRRSLDEDKLIAGLIEAGAFYLRVQKTQEAATVLEEALPLVQAKFGNTNTNYALLRTLMASAALQRGDTAEAAELYDRYLMGLEILLGAANEIIVMLYNDYALSLEKLGRTDQLGQLKLYLRAMEDASTFEPARLALMACRAKLQKDRNAEEASECFDKALALPKVFPPGYRTAGSLLLWFADANRESIKYFEKALAQYTVYPVVYNEMAYAYIGLDDFDAAMDVAELQVKLAPGDANAYDTLGDVYKSKGNLEKALELYRTACALGMQTSCERRELQE